MSEILWIKNGRIIDPANNRDAIGDLFAIDGRIVDGLSDAQKKESVSIDADNLVVCPGLIDVHVHLREPGQTHKETIQTGSWAAAAGGFTTIVCMPNTSPVADNVGTIQQIQDAIKRDAVVNVLPTGTLTIGLKGEHLAPTGSLKKAGIVAVTDDGLCVQNNEIMRRAVEYADMFDLLVMDHCQDASLTVDAVMNEGHWSMRLGLQGWPNAAEDIIVSRNVILSTYTGAHIHMQHISSANSVDILRRAKQRGVNVTAEVSPHHMHLTDECLRDYNTHFKMNPPLRTESDRQALIEGLLDGTLDIIATDHAPHTNDEKDREFDYAPFGVIGMETALAVSLEALYHDRKCDLSTVIDLLTRKPANILKLDRGTLSTGIHADIALIDPDESWTVDVSQFKSRSSNCPWAGQTLRGKVKKTLVSGRIVYDGESIVLPS